MRKNYEVVAALALLVVGASFILNPVSCALGGRDGFSERRSTHDTGGDFDGLTAAPAGVKTNMGILGPDTKGDALYQIVDIGAWGQMYRYSAGTNQGSHSCILADAVWEDPVAISKHSGAEQKNYAVYATYDDATGAIGSVFVYASLLQSSGFGKISGAVYDSAGNLVSSAGWSVYSTSAGWLEFVQSGGSFVEGQDYFVALGVSFDATQDEVYIADAAVGVDASNNILLENTPELTLSPYISASNNIDLTNTPALSLGSMIDTCTYTQISGQWYRCIVRHTPTAERMPGSGIDWDTFWKMVGPPGERPGVLHPGLNDTVDWTEG